MAKNLTYATVYKLQGNTKWLFEVGLWLNLNLQYARKLLYQLTYEGIQDTNLAQSQIEIWNLSVYIFVIQNLLCSI